VVVLEFPDDLGIQDTLRKRLKGLSNKEGLAVAFEIQKLEDIRVAAERDLLSRSRMATFNHRYDVFVLDPQPGPALVVARDRQTARFVLTDVVEHWPTPDHAIAQSAIALNETVTERYIQPRR
jgi:hypothetical protein